MVAICIGAYFAIGCVTAGALWEVTRNDGATFFGGLFWPIAWLVTVGIGLGVAGRMLARHWSGVDQ